MLTLNLEPTLVFANLDAEHLDALEAILGLHPDWTAAITVDEQRDALTQAISQNKLVGNPRIEAFHDAVMATIQSWPFWAASRDDIEVVPEVEQHYTRALMALASGVGSALVASRAFCRGFKDIDVTALERR